MIKLLREQKFLRGLWGARRSHGVRADKTFLLQKGKRGAHAGKKISVRTFSHGKHSLPVSKRETKQAKVVFACLAFVVATALMWPLCGIAAQNDTVAGNAADEGAVDWSALNTTAKNEVVYARLSAQGAIEGMYVVNILTPDTPGYVVDYGTYTAVQGLSDVGALSQDGDRITAQVDGAKLSYQGDLANAHLPWNFDITYTLDGKTIAPAQLAGAKGALGITIKTTANSSVDQAFFDNYLLQITMVFSSEKAKNIQTSTGQIAMAGSDSQVTFVGMPGKEDTFEVTASVDNFEMDAIQFAAVPFSMVIDMPNTDELISGLSQMGSGALQLSQGASGLAGGISGLESNMGAMASGATEVASGVNGVVSGVSGVSQGIAAYQQGLYNQSAQAQGMASDPAALQQEYETALADYMSAYSVAYTSAYSAAFVPEYLAAYQTALTQGLTSEEAASSATASAAAAAAPAAATAAPQDAGVQASLGSLASVSGNMATSAGYTASAQALSAAADSLGSASDEGSLLGAAAALATGAAGLASGASELASGASSFSAGISQLSSGASELASGAATFSTEAQALPDVVQAQIDAMIASYDKSSFEPRSFVSAKNTNVELVQFVAITETIALPEPVVEEPVSQNADFFSRFLALFEF